VQKWRKQELLEIESKAGIKLNSVSKQSEWEFNQKYISVDYIIGNFFIDMLAVVPFFLGRTVDKVYLSMRFFRLFRVQRILNRLDEFSSKFKDKFIE
jgi:hypothetical protein